MFKLRRFGGRRSKCEEQNLPSGSTVLIHIGKSGGRTVRDGIKNAVRNHVDHEVHIRQPVYRHDLNYVVVARAPIPRLESAFRWRHKILLDDGNQRDRFQGEYDVLKRYSSLNAIAEKLYDDKGVADPEAHGDIKKIHHIRENMSFYLRDLLSLCSPEQIVAVLMQESLDRDIERVFGYENLLRKHRNDENSSGSHLSEHAISNLRRCFYSDFEALIKLYSWGKIDREVFLMACK